MLQRIQQNTFHISLFRNLHLKKSVGYERKVKASCDNISFCNTNGNINTTENRLHRL